MVETLHVTTVRSLFRNWQAGAGQARHDPFQSSRGTREHDGHSILGSLRRRKEAGEIERSTRIEGVGGARRAVSDAIRQSHDHVSDNFGDLYVS